MASVRSGRMATDSKPRSARRPCPLSARSMPAWAWAHVYVHIRLRGLLSCRQEEQLNHVGVILLKAATLETACLQKSSAHSSRAAGAPPCERPLEATLGCARAERLGLRRLLQCSPPVSSCSLWLHGTDILS